MGRDIDDGVGGRVATVIYNKGDVDRVADGGKVLSDSLWY